MASRIERLIREILGRRMTSLRKLDSVPQARSYLGKTPIDILLLDLDGQDGDPFSVLEDSVAASFQTIVYSATSEQALKAHHFGVLGYVSKPVERAPLERVLQRLLDAQSRANYAVRYLSVRRRGGIRLINIDDVVYAKGAGPYSELVMRDGSTELHNKSLDALLELLPGVFERIHRSYIVNMGAVTNFLAHEGSRYEAELDCGTKLPVGRTRFRRIRERLR